MEDKVKSVNKSLTILEESPEWDDYLASEEALAEKELSPKPKEPTYLEKSPDSSKFQLPLNLFLIMFIVSLFRWENTIPYGLEASYNSVFVEGEYYRLATSLFVHADLSHLLSNGWIFLVFAFLLYNYYGFAVFPLVSLLCGILTTAVTVYFYPPTVRLVGASGMVYSMVAIWLVFFLRFDTRYKFFIRLVRAIAFILVILFPSEIKPQTSYSAHAYGFLIGFIAALCMLPMVSRRIQTKEGLSHRI